MCDTVMLILSLQYGDEDYDNMGEDDYDDYSKELNQYKKTKDRDRDRGRGKFGHQCVTLIFSVISIKDIAAHFIHMAFLEQAQAGAVIHMVCFG